MEFIRIDDFKFKVKTKYGEVELNKRELWHNYSTAVELLGVEAVDKSIATIEYKAFADTTASESCGRHKPEAYQSWGNTQRLLDWYSEGDACGKAYITSYYVGASQYQSKIDVKVFKDFIINKYPMLDRLLKLEFYSFDGFPEVYIKDKVDKSESLYVPFKALADGDFNIAIDRMTSYNKGTGYCDYEKFKDEDYSVFARKIIDGDVVDGELIQRLKDKVYSEDMKELERQRLVLEEEATALQDVYDKKLIEIEELEKKILEAKK